MLILGVFSQYFNVDIIKKFPALYITGQKEKNQIYQNFFMKSSIEAIL